MSWVPPHVYVRVTHASPATMGLQRAASRLGGRYPARECLPLCLNGLMPFTQIRAYGATSCPQSSREAQIITRLLSQSD